MINNEYKKTRFKIAILFFAIFFLLISVVNLVTLTRQNIGLGRLDEFRGMGRMFLNQEEFKRRIDEQKERVITDAIILELSLSLIGAAIAYFLSDFLLIPIKRNVENQKKFLSYASHELKTPITTILLLSENEDSEKMKSINEETQKLNILTSKYLEILSVDNSIVKTQTNILNLLEEVLKDFNSPILNEKINLKLDIPADLSVNTIQSDLKIVFRNILENAIKYIGEPKNIEIKSSVIKNMIVIEITNTFKDDGFKKGYGLGSEIIKYHSSQNGYKYSFNKTDKLAVSKLELPN